MTNGLLQLPELQGRLTANCDRCVVRLVGALDIATAPACQEWLNRSLTGTCATCVVDLRDVGYLGSEGVRFLLRLRLWLQEKRIELRVAVQTGSGVERVLRLVHLDQLIPLDACPSTSPESPPAGGCEAGHYRCLLRPAA